MRRVFAAATVAALSGLFAANASAATAAVTLTYDLNQTNIGGFPAGSYATVGISNVDPGTGVAGPSIYFDVKPTSFFNTAPLSEGLNFGLQDFSFNVASGIHVGASNLNLISPSGGWRVSFDRNAGGGYGFFDVQYSGTGSSRATDLQFSIDGVSGDTPSSYAVANPGGYLFAGHIAGFNWAGSTVSSGQFAAPVPIPAPVWLFASGLLALAGVAARRRR